ncbi:MAG TPA: lysozyme [Oligoflexus sp.]|uniref:lysozyme n=1 Tax=Oligoflexus sp. TaxID=1971216 RepID=UPI002D44B1BA|nr:lysozyme [Oligoflexus sp.]HYX39928.1 lysozyme [Oligoflexus sp.]
MKLSLEGRRFIQALEMCRLEAYPDGKHKDGSDKWSIGWGHNGNDVKPGMKITQAKADALFLEDVAWAEAAVIKNVTISLQPNEFDALVCFVYNIGEPRFKTSTLLARLNAGDRAAAAHNFLRWNRYLGKINAGLVKRRAAERHRFLGFSVAASLKAGDQAHAVHTKRL